MGRAGERAEPEALVDEMLKANALRSLVSDERALVDCITACQACGQACVACADACLAEERVDALRRCIRLTSDCADICETTARLLTRQLEPDREVLIAQLQLVALVCHVCTDECSEHAQMHEHCRICMEVCRRCEEASLALVHALGEETGVPLSH